MDDLFQEWCPFYAVLDSYRLNHFRLWSLRKIKFKQGTPLPYNLGYIGHDLKTLFSPEIAYYEKISCSITSQNLPVNVALRR